MNESRIYGLPCAATSSHSCDGEMLKKIISAGKNSAERAALDAALHLDLPYSGCISGGEEVPDADDPASFSLLQPASDSPEDCIEKCVRDSDATLILTHGGIAGSSALCRDFAQSLDRPWLHIDLTQSAAFRASTLIADWLVKENVAVLNVAGSQPEGELNARRKIFHILTSAYWLSHSKSVETKTEGNFSHGLLSGTDLPQTVQGAVSRLVAEMGLKDKTTMANMTEEELIRLNSSLGTFIRSTYGLWSENELLLSSCRSISGDINFHREDAAAVIIRELWKELKRTHKLRIVK